MLQHQDASQIDVSVQDYKSARVGQQWHTTDVVIAPADLCRGKLQAPYNAASGSLST